MNKDGTLAKKKSKGREYTNDVWYGRTVIKSCSRLDYATAQNIIDRKVANGEKVGDIDEKLWPRSRYVKNVDMLLIFSQSMTIKQLIPNLRLSLLDNQLADTVLTMLLQMSDSCIQLPCPEENYDLKMAP